MRVAKTDILKNVGNLFILLIYILISTYLPTYGSTEDFLSQTIGFLQELQNTTFLLVAKIPVSLFAEEIHSQILFKWNYLFSAY